MGKAILARLYEDTKIVVDATDGSETIANAEHIFNRAIDPDFENCGSNKPTTTTKRQLVSMYELVRNATFTNIFGSLGDLDTLVMTQGQIIKFCVDHRDKLRTNRPATFFLFKVNGKYFVAYVDADERGLGIYVYNLNNSNVWGDIDHHRVVVPRL